MFEGVRVIELTEWGMVPSAGAICADWGADVIKIEHSRREDPLRALVTGRVRGVPWQWEHFNRGKRGIALDVASPRGYEILTKLVSTADVFLTSFMAPARERLKVDDATLEALNPRLVYAVGHGQGQRGPDKDKPGFDAISYWARGGIGYKLTDPDGAYVDEPAAFGDVMGGLSLAAGIAAALFRRSVSGRGGRVDISLLNVATWQLAPDILIANLVGHDLKRMSVAAAFRNPLVGCYRSSDGRIFRFNMILDERYWPNLCRAFEREDLIDHPDYSSTALRAQNFDALETLVRETFATRTAAEWEERLTANDCPSDPVRTPYEVVSDAQVMANGYLVADPKEPRTLLAMAPIQYRNQLPEVRAGAPDYGQHTDEILGELGYDAQSVAALREQGIVA
jgi:crotonobetainyl-CoA:carnitine CoA-transferase CaiB-like acyl-CoA transferase